jgi:hypothetical protein
MCSIKERVEEIRDTSLVCYKKVIVEWIPKEHLKKGAISA